MKYLAHIAGALLGLAFVAFGVLVLFGLAPAQKVPEGTPAAHFMAAFVPTGYLTFVKVLEVLGGLLVAVPRTRNLGLLILGPILVNILAYHLFVTGGQDLLNPLLIILVLLALYLLWVERAAFLGLVTRPTKTPSA